jgi:soluble lytic murein transglycosylase-like protein
VPQHYTSTVACSHPSRARLSSFPAFAVDQMGAGFGRRLRVVLGIGLAVAMTLASSEAYSQSTAVRRVVPDTLAVPFAAFIAEASQRFGIPAAWIRAVMRAESFGDVRTISPKGAMGLMQIMPDTWAGLRRRYALGVDPYNAHDNIIAGAAYLRQLHDRYGIPGFLAAYNAGPARWEDHLATGRPLPAETRAYLARLAPIVGGGAAEDAVLLASIVQSWTEASLFPARPARSPGDGQPALKRQSSRRTNDRPVEDWTGLAPQSNGLFIALSSQERSQ